MSYNINSLSDNRMKTRLYIGDMLTTYLFFYKKRAVDQTAL